MSGRGSRSPSIRMGRASAAGVSLASWMEYYTRGAILATYVVSAITKLINSKTYYSTLLLHFEPAKR